MVVQARSRRPARGRSPGVLREDGRTCCCIDRIESFAGSYRKEPAAITVHRLGEGVACGNDSRRRGTSPGPASASAGFHRHRTHRRPRRQPRCQRALWHASRHQPSTIAPLPSQRECRAAYRSAILATVSRTSTGDVGAVDAAGVLETRCTSSSAMTQCVIVTTEAGARKTQREGRLGDSTRPASASRATSARVARSRRQRRTHRPPACSATQRHRAASSKWQLIDCGQPGQPT